MSKVITTQLNMIDETTKHNRAKGYYKRIALAGDTTGAFKEAVRSRDHEVWFRNTSTTSTTRGYRNESNQRLYET